MNPTLYNRLRQVSRSDERRWPHPLRRWQQGERRISPAPDGSQSPCAAAVPEGQDQQARPGLLSARCDEADPGDFSISFSAFSDSTPCDSSPGDCTPGDAAQLVDRTPREPAVRREPSTAMSSQAEATSAGPTRAISKPEEPATETIPQPELQLKQQPRPWLELLLWVALVLFDGAMAAVALARSLRAAWSQAGGSRPQVELPAHPAPAGANRWGAVVAIH